VASVTDPANRTTYYTYDASDRLTTTTFSGSSDVVVNTYDARDRLIARKDTRIPTTDYSTSQSFAYVYDKHDRLLCVVYPDGEQLRYTYDTAGQRTTLTDPDGNVTTYNYNALSNNKKLGSIAHSLFGTTDYYYDPKGLLDTEAYSNFSYNYWVYDSLNRVSSTTAVDGKDFYTLLSEENSYNAASIRTRVDYMRSSPFGSSYYKLYGYDKALRLKSQDQYNSDTDDREWGYHYTYDLAGNRTQMQEFDGTTTTTTSYTYNDFNQLDGDSDAHEYNYDDNGNLVERAHGGSREYLHDRHNRMVGFDGPATVDYAYDSSGRMLLRTGPDGTKTKYYYDGINLLLVKEKEDGGVWRTKKVNALKEADIGQIIAHREYTAWSGSTPTAYTDRYYHYDLLGNTTALTDATGAVAAQYEMEAFGTVKSGGQAGVHLTTKEWDADSELYYFNARWYNASRWIGAEPTGVDGPNLYAPIGNNPIRYYDPNGLQVIEGIDAIYQTDIPTAWKADGFADETTADPTYRRLPGKHNGPADAYRHCLWSCKMAKNFGAVKAQAIGDIHEKHGVSPPGEVCMDKCNNREGRKCAATKSCENCCLYKLRYGRLCKHAGVRGNDEDLPWPNQNH